MTTPTFEIIEYTCAEMILANKLTGKEYTYFGCPRAKYDKIKTFLANDRNADAFMLLKAYGDRKRIEMETQKEMI